MGTLAQICLAAVNKSSVLGLAPACACRQATLSLINLFIAFWDGLVAVRMSGGTI